MKRIDVKKLLRQTHIEAMAKAARESQEFLDTWLPKGSYLRQRFDQERRNTFLTYEYIY